MYKCGSEACWSRSSWSGEDLTPSKSFFFSLRVLLLGTARLRCHISPHIIMSNTTTMQDNAITLARKMLCVSGERKQTTFKPTINTQDCLVTLFHCNDVVFFSSMFTLRNTTLFFNPETWTSSKLSVASSLGLTSLNARYFLCLWTRNFVINSHIWPSVTSNQQDN